jgi:hypothetical protein
MPDTLFCHRCSLLLELGDYHFHTQRDWRGANLYGCLKCGTQHRFLMARTDPSEEAFYALQFQPKPLNGTVRDELYEPTEYFDFQPDMSSEEFTVDRNKFPKAQLEESLKTINCAYCKSEGSLSNDWRQFSICPRCGSERFEIVAWWMT